MKRIKLDESQKDEVMNILSEMVSEDLDPNNDITINKTNLTPSEKINPVAALDGVDKVAKTHGIDTNNPNVHTSVTAKVGGTEKEITTSPIKESIVINKKQLDEVRLKKLKHGSELLKVKDFVK